MECGSTVPCPVERHQSEIGMKTARILFNAVKEAQAFRMPSFVVVQPVHAPPTCPVRSLSIIVPIAGRPGRRILRETLCSVFQPFTDRFVADPPISLTFYATRRDATQRLPSPRALTWHAALLNKLPTSFPLRHCSFSFEISLVLSFFLCSFHQTFRLTLLHLTSATT